MQLFMIERLTAEEESWKKRRFLGIKGLGVVGFGSHEKAGKGLKVWRKKNPGLKHPFRIVPFVEIPDGEE